MNLEDLKASIAARQLKIENLKLRVEKQRRKHLKSSHLLSEIKALKTEIFVLEKPYKKELERQYNKWWRKLLRSFGFDF